MEKATIQDAGWVIFVVNASQIDGRSVGLRIRSRAAAAQPAPRRRRRDHPSRRIYHAQLNQSSTNGPIRVSRGRNNIKGGKRSATSTGYAATPTTQPGGRHAACGHDGARGSKAFVKNEVVRSVVRAQPTRAPRGRGNLESSA